MTAAGSVVAITEPSSRQTTSGKPAIGQSAKPTTAVQTIVATTASIRIGAASSSIRRTSTVIAPSKTSSGKKDVNEGLRADRQIGEQPCEVAERWETGVCTRTIDDRADRHPDDGEEHHRRNLEPNRHRLRDGDDDEQGREDGEEQDDIEHRGENLSGRRLWGARLRSAFQCRDRYPPPKAADRASPWTQGSS